MDLQQIVALAIVAVAAGWLLSRLWRQARGHTEGGCPGCGECGRPPQAAGVASRPRPAPKATPLVTLDPKPRPRPPAEVAPAPPTAPRGE